LSATTVSFCTALGTSPGLDAARAIGEADRRRRIYGRAERDRQQVEGLPDLVAVVRHAHDAAVELGSSACTTSSRAFGMWSP
jgi:hypothetical protein